MILRSEKGKEKKEKKEDNIIGQLFADEVITESEEGRAVKEDEGKENKEAKERIQEVEVWISDSENIEEVYKAFEMERIGRKNECTGCKHKRTENREEEMIAEGDGLVVLSGNVKGRDTEEEGTSQENRLEKNRKLQETITRMDEEETVQLGNCRKLKEGRRKHGRNLAMEENNENRWSTERLRKRVENEGPQEMEETGQLGNSRKLKEGRRKHGRNLAREENDENRWSTERLRKRVENEGPQEIKKTKKFEEKKGKM